MRSVIIFMLLAAAMSVVAANESPLHFAENEVRTLWSAWKAEHSMEFHASQELKRLSIFWDNLEKIHAHNKSGASYTMAMNRFGALTSDEFKKQYASTEIPTSVDREYVDDSELEAIQAPSSVDWRKKGAVTPVKNQGQCGSCWSFSAAQAVEGANAIAGNDLVVLSEKNLMDCSWSYGNMGCNGGLMDNAFKYVKKHGLATEKAYPYHPRSSHTCKHHKAAVHISGYKDVPANQSAFIKALSGRPLSIAIEADQHGFQFYSGGVFDGTCGDMLDHGVLAVGYDKDSVIVKNSWGASWGDKGYIRLTRKNRNGGAGQCGMFSRASYPIGKKSSDFNKKTPRASMWQTILSKLRDSVGSTLLRGNPLHASCKGKWTFKGKKCSDVVDSVLSNAKSMSSLQNCKGEKCGYSIKSSSASKISLVHETPVKHYKDDITLSFADASGDCVMDGYSTSETWYAHLDYGTNLCNIRNVLGKYDNEELGACTQASSADCSKY